MSSALDPDEPAPRQRCFLALDPHHCDAHDERVRFEAALGRLGLQALLPSLRLLW